jgi:protein-tyrosine-phosphatase
MAEGIARSYAAIRQRRLEVQSAGTLQIEGQPADSKAVAVCQEMGVDISNHVSQGLTEELVDWADYILVMEYRHALVVREKFDEECDVLLLGNLIGLMEIPDPIGSWKFKFRKCRDQIKACVEAFVDRLPAS